MSTKTFSHEDFAKQSMIELANIIMLEEKREMSFKDTFEKVAKLKDWGEEDKQAKIAQFYTDLNADGRFVTQGANVWGLKKWYRKGTGGKLAVDENQSVKSKPKAVKEKAGHYSDEEEELIIGKDIDETIDDYENEEYDEEGVDDEVDGLNFDEDDEDF